MFFLFHLSFRCFCLSFLGKLRGALMFAPKGLQLSPFCADLSWKLTLYCELQCKNDAKIKQNKKIRKKMYSYTQSLYSLVRKLNPNHRNWELPVWEDATGDAAGTAEDKIAARWISCNAITFININRIMYGNVKGFQYMAKQARCQGALPLTAVLAVCEPYPFASLIFWR